MLIIFSGKAVILNDQYYSIVRQVMELEPNIYHITNLNMSIAELNMLRFINNVIQQYVIHSDFLGNKSRFFKIMYKISKAQEEIINARLDYNIEIYPDITLSPSRRYQICFFFQKNLLNLAKKNKKIFSIYTSFLNSMFQMMKKFWLIQNSDIFIECYKLFSKKKIYQFHEAMDILIKKITSISGEDYEVILSKVIDEAQKTVKFSLPFITLTILNSLFRKFRTISRELHSQFFLYIKKKRRLGIKHITMLYEYYRVQTELYSSNEIEDYYTIIIRILGKKLENLMVKKRT